MHIKGVGAYALEVAASEPHNWRKTKSSYMFGLNDKGSGLNIGNLDYHQSVTERRRNLVLEFA